MSTSPTPATAPSQKRPLEEPSSPNGPTDQPDAKRPALDKAKEPHDLVESTPTPVVQPAEEVAKSPTAPVEPITPSNGTTDGQGDTVVPDAPPAGMPSAAQVLETQPIQSTAANGTHTTHDQASYQQQDESNWLHVRAIISSTEAATVIGKGGENVSQIRRMSGAKCTVSDYSRGAVERILTVSGLVDAVAKVTCLTFILAQPPLTPCTGLWSHHPHIEHRAPRVSLDSSIQDLPAAPADSSHPHWLHHR